MTEFAFLIPLLQLFSFLMIVFFLRWREKVASGFAISMIVTAWLMSVWILIETISKYMGAHGGEVVPYEWRHAADLVCQESISKSAFWSIR